MAELSPIADTVEGAVKGLGDLALGLIREFHVSPERAAELQMQVQKQSDTVLSYFTDLDKAQIAVNQEEAKSSSLFVAGWRPAIGWICAGTLAYVFVLRDMFVWVIAVGHYQVPTPPLLMQDSIMELVFCMLGWGGIRAFEKYKGVARETHK